MILYYVIDREILNEIHVYDQKTKYIRYIEAMVEYELKQIVFLMPLDERVIISPTFRFESPICRRILKRNQAFADKGYLSQYMKESSEYDFKEKKAERYKFAFSICEDYKSAYSDKKTYEKVKEIWIPKISKTEPVGISSRLIFSEKIRRIGKEKSVPSETVEEILKIVNDISDDAFLWEVVEYELLKRNIPKRIIQLLQIRQEMNKSYLNVFQSQGIQIPYNSIVNGGTLEHHGIYDMWKIGTIFRTLKIETIINFESAENISKLHEDLELQNILQIIRDGIKNEQNVELICEEVSKKGDIRKMVLSILGSDRQEDLLEKNENVFLQEDTLKLLHLSDLHLTEMKSMKDSYFFLKIDLMKQMNLRKLDYLVISGDVCDRPTEEQYSVALSFIKNLINDFGIDLRKVIIVTGNHDCNRDISKKAYDEKAKVFNESERKKRFETYSTFFYQPLFSRDFPLDYDSQIERIKDDEHKIYIVGFNSSYQIDHIETEKSGICMDAIRNDDIGIELDNSYIKLLTWHHPISGYCAIQDTTFMDTLAISKYKACFHGHIHEAAKDNYGYDDTHELKMVGAGSLGALQKDRADGIPLQYNLVEIDVKGRKLIVHTRKREKENGVWMADARWGDKNRNPKSHYYVYV